MTQAWRPRVTLKLATSLDGRIATAAGQSRWITGAVARAEVHRMRAAHDCVLVGIGTALADDPELTVRGDPAPSFQPLRVVIDSACRLPASSKLARSAAVAAVAIYAGPVADQARQDALRALGVDVRIIAADGEPRLDLAGAFGDLKTRGVASVLVEGGGRIAASLLSQNLVDRLEWMRGPILLGADGVPAVGGLPIDDLAQAPRFRRIKLTTLGDDVWETYEL